MVLPDYMIRKLAAEKGMIQPCAEPTSGGVISYGISSYGYDMRLTDEFKVYAPKQKKTVDPKAIQPEDFLDFTGKILELPALTFCLGKSLEYFRIPRNVITICMGKSTYARCGVLVNVTPLEPEWEGHVTMQIVNTTPASVKIYAEEGIAQVLFLQSEWLPEVSYADKGGKYQGTKDITLSKT
ncbi:dCTP deaminase [candidate division FCPU426 bacterium]|nr:dCTP deaminase [candidate division FCPU426 bacterium]